jgi:hypothetical protein
MKKSSPQPKQTKLRSGTAAIEFAIVCPILVLFGLACSDFGRIFTDYQTISNAARVGAELGAAKSYTNLTRPLWESNIETAILSELENLDSFDASNFSYTLSTTLDAEGMTHVIVEVEYIFHTSVTWPLLPPETVLRKHVEFVQFR